jgi:sugar diacid utilization regulator
MIELCFIRGWTLDNISMEDRKINKFIYDFSIGTSWTIRQARAEAKIYGFDLSVARVAIVIDIGGEARNILFSEEITKARKTLCWSDQALDFILA